MGTTRTEALYEILRADLMSAKYRPGQWLKASDLQVQFEASLSVVREVLSRLAAEGLLVAAPQRGFRVIELSVQDLQDLTAARTQIESIVLRESLQHGDTVWEAQLLAAHHVLDRTSMQTPEGRFNRAWLPAHAAFHGALMEGCPNARLRGIAGELRDSAEMYRMWSPRSSQTPRDITAEHRALLDAALARDVDLCVTLLGDHIGATAALLAESASEITV